MTTIKIIKLLTVIALTISAHVNAFAQSYPEKPIKIIMPWADGFPANSARLYAKELNNKFKYITVLETKAGAGGELAARQVVNAANDGYTLLVTGSSITIRSVIDQKNIDPEKELQPIAQITTTPYVIVAKAGQFGNFKNFIASAQNNPGKINFASAGIGTGMHFLGELLNTNANINIVHIPYQTGSRQLQAVLAGDVDIAIISVVTALPQIKSGALEALAVSTTKRSKVLPNTPTLAELGIKNIPSIGAWIAVFGPKNMDPNAVKILSEKISAIAIDPSVIELVNSWGADLPDTKVSSLEEVIKSEKKSWEQIAKEKNLKANN